MDVTFSRRAWKTVYYHLKRKAPHCNWDHLPDPMLSTREGRTFPLMTARTFIKVWETLHYRTPPSKHRLHIEALTPYHFMVTAHGKKRNQVDCDTEFIKRFF